MSFIFSRHSCCCISVFSPRIRLSAIIYSDPWIKNGGGRKYDFRWTVHVITTLHIIFIAPKGSRTSDLYPNHGAYNYCFIIKVNVFFCRRFAKKTFWQWTVLGFTSRKRESATEIVYVGRFFLLLKIQQRSLLWIRCCVKGGCTIPVGIMVGD